MAPAERRELGTVVGSARDSLFAQTIDGTLQVQNLRYDICSSLSVEIHRFSFKRILPRISRMRDTVYARCALGSQQGQRLEGGLRAGECQNGGADCETLNRARHK